MTGSFGTDDDEDGVFARTVSPTKSGAFFRNNSTSEATAPAGSGAFGLTVAPGGAGLFGANNGAGPLGRGVQGNGPEAGVGGWSEHGTGVIAHSNNGDGLVASANASTKSAVFGRNDATDAASAPGGSGVFGVTMAPGAAGVFGANNHAGASGVGVQGNGPEAGVSGWSKNGTGVIAHSNSGDGLVASANSSTKSAVFGRNDATDSASASGGSGVFGVTMAPGAAGVFGANNHTGPSGVGVQGNGPEAGVSGWSSSGTGVRGLSDNIGLFAQGGNLAARFVGNVEVNGTVDVSGDVRLVNADCAEDFDLAGATAVDPGTVMVLDENGELIPCGRAYDRRVAGVISGAGSFRPALVLDQRKTGRTRQPLALMGKVYCQVDASYQPIDVGDLLTTSPTPGMAMAATDAMRAFGCVIGKALAPHRAGLGLIPILVSLQ